MIGKLIILGSIVVIVALGFYYLGNFRENDNLVLVDNNENEDSKTEIIEVSPEVNIAAGEKDEVCFDDVCFEVEIADNKEERQKGLMFRESLDKNKGMLFIFDSSGVYPFWMKNTLIPLDIIWINEEKEVVFIKENAQPCGQGFCPNINPEKGALYILEINSGIVNEIGLGVGEKIDLEL